MGSLQVILILLAASVFTIIFFRRFNLPPIIGYLFVGGVIGPHALNLSYNINQARHLAEFGIVFLMFTIGLEFSYKKLKEMKRFVIGSGSLQMIASVLIIALITMLFGYNWQIGLTIGGILATSSTAIISKLLNEHNAFESDHGREIIGVLLLQDLAVVPLLIILPALSQPPEKLLITLAIAFAKAILVLSVLFLLGPRLMNRWFDIVVKTKSSELFMLNILMITLGLAYLTEVTGLSMALGAFIAGMLIAETDYHLQVEADIKPFRDVLLGLFFVTVGVYIDIYTLLAQWWKVLLVTLLFIFLKAGIMWQVSRLIGNRHGNALRSALWLCSGGEFGFVILAITHLPHHVHQILISSILLSMLIAPLLISYSEKIVLKLVASEWQFRSMLLTKQVAQAMNKRDHVIICGYGRSGKYLQSLFKEENIANIAIDIDREQCKNASSSDVIYGDASKREVLRSIAISRAKLVVISIAQYRIALNIITAIRQISPDIPILVRSYDEKNLDQLINAGATEVIPEYFEGSISIASQAFLLCGVPIHQVLHNIRSIRAKRYSIMRDSMNGMIDFD